VVLSAVEPNEEEAEECYSFASIDDSFFDSLGSGSGASKEDSYTVVSLEEYVFDNEEEPEFAFSGMDVPTDAGMPFGAGEKALAELIERTAAMAPAELAAWGARAEGRARSRYHWEQVTDQYENLLSAMIQRPRRLS
jgi:hypothetical protein